ncbi:DUF3568 domain-containing protein [Marispirochaeta aestuarii]|uniref:DUF3568 domain-containing protein n=1 Tax=Marispirochaeta aestuarii TaxID=1963862 RepID=UPI0029C9920A|nr:DUF3568 domain-containing protein [Marispirochaeta aestuarii]
MKKIQGIHAWLIPVLLMLIIATTAGCVLLAGGAVGAGTYAYVSGNLKTTYDASLQQTWNATLKALQSLDLKTDEEEFDAFTGVLKGNMADGREFYINLKKVTAETTEVAIRIGMGDQKVSKTIHGEILANLQ